MVAACDPRVWEGLRGARLCLTGCTGFVGAWLLAALEWGTTEFELGLEAVALTRDPAQVGHRLPWVTALPWLRLRRGDVRSFHVGDERFTHVIVGATSADAALTASEPLTTLDIALTGCLRTLDVSRHSGARTLLLSSGAVYGPLPASLERVPEDFLGMSDCLTPTGAYAEAKRASEAMVSAAADQYDLHVSVARLFAFLGPWLPTDRHLAAGNFVEAAVRGGPIVVHGDGSPIRSYLYGADLAVWLLTILARGGSRRAYNVGSENAVSIAELAGLAAAEVRPAARVEIIGVVEGGQGGMRYLPSTQRARDELGLTETIDLAEALARTVAWRRDAGVSAT